MREANSCCHGRSGTHIAHTHTSQGRSSVVVTLSKHLPYPGDSSCNLTINAPWADGLLFVVRMINMRWDNSRCLDHMKLSDKNQVLLAPLCSARAIGTRFVAIPEKQVNLEVKTHPSSPSRNYTGLNLAFTGYVNEIRCDLDEMFLCQKTGVCISKTLLCDQVDHCGDRSDEPQDCEYHGKPTWIDWAPLLSWCVICALFGGAFFRVYWRKRRLQLKEQ
ncbi:uncharacterized protein ISCGN_017842 [Ixodes scapularis]